MRIWFVCVVCVSVIMYVFGVCGYVCECVFVCVVCVYVCAMCVSCVFVCECVCVL